jgi:hypothetical protein
MIHNYSTQINLLIHDIVDDKLKQILSTNHEIKEGILDRTIYEQAFSDLFDRMDKGDKKVIDDYLSFSNYIDSVVFCEIYKCGFNDCVDFLKDLKVI